MAIGTLLKNRRVGVGETAVVIPSGNTVDRPSHPVFGSIRFNIDLGHVEFWDGIQWRNMAIEGQTEITVDKFTGDDVTTIFNPISFTVNNAEDILVFVGNVWQAPIDNYTISTANDLVLPFAPAGGIDIHVIHGFNSNISA